ncbi:MAG: arsenite efflux transporter metallochaperone ArsD [bacterium]
MARTLPLNNPADVIAEASVTVSTVTGTISVYDPAMCCSTGVCGPGVDSSLIAAARDLRWLEAQGVTVERFGLSQEPDAFVKQPKVTGLMQAFGDAALPATLINGEVFAYGRYPSREELVSALRAAPGSAAPASSSDQSGCCAPGSGCC